MNSAHLRHAALALSAAYMALLPQFYFIFDVGNRFEMSWGRVHHASITTAILVLALAWWVLYQLAMLAVRRRKRLATGVGFSVAWLLAVILVRSAVSIMDRSEAVSDMVMGWISRPGVKVAYYAMLPLALIGLFRDRFVRGMRNIYYAVIPLWIYVMLVPLTWAVYDANDDVAAVRGGDSASTGHESYPLILLFIFDAWAYDVTFPDGEVRTDLPHIARLADESVVYHRAYSPGVVTYQSMPLLYFPGSRTFQDVEDNRGFLHHFVKSDDRVGEPSIYDWVPDDWNRLAFAPHESVLLVRHAADQAVWVREHACRQGYGEETWRLLSSQLTPLRFVGLHPYRWFRCDLCDIGREMPPGMPTWKWKEPLKWALSTVWIHQKALRIIRDSDRPTFAIFHYCLPHDPYIWAHGRMKQRITADMLDDHKLDNYLQNLRQLDVMVGELVDTLKKAGRYDEVMLIMLSDHSWQYEGDRKHIPIIVKRPDQRERIDIDEPAGYHSVVAEIEGVVRSLSGVQESARP